MNLYSVFDSKSRIFCNPFVSHNDQTALRDFARAAIDPSLEIGKYPSDFSLHLIGSFDRQTGFLTPESTPINLGLAASLINFDQE